MSCWETSTFLTNVNIMNQEILVAVCKKLGWKIQTKGNTVTILDANQGTNLHGEYALKLEGNKVSYNNYYMKNGLEKLENLKAAYMEMLLPHLETKIKTIFRAAGYSVKPNTRFKASNKIHTSFFMVAKSTSKEELGVEGKIKFTLFKDGTVATDSNYIPTDIHDLADQAMENLEEVFGNKRNITPKPRHLIPASQRNKMHCKAKSQNTIKLKKK